jgi:hypothetical protein
VALAELKAAAAVPVIATVAPKTEPTIRSERSIALILFEFELMNLP